MVNIDITAAGATLALGLMFLKTNNASVAARLSIPDTNFLMEYVRPDYLLLRVVSKALVMWDDIKPTQAWIESQVSLCLQHPRMLCLRHPRMLCLQHPQWLIAWPVSLLQSCLHCTVCAGAPR